MEKKLFSSKNEAVKYYGHSWNYIKKHYHVVNCISGKYCISKC